MPAQHWFLNGAWSLELDPSRVLASWDGPTGQTGEVVRQNTRRQIENPIDFPPLRQAVVPGDRVVIAVDSNLPEMAEVLAPILEILREGEVNFEQIEIVATGPTPDPAIDLGVPLHLHDRHDRASLAYLATTANEHRVYLHRSLVEADFVLAVGLAAPSLLSGTSGPWTTLYPGLADADALKRVQADHASGEESLRDEMMEVSWLLGNQFQVAVIPGTQGVREIMAGEARKVAETATRRLEKLWTFPLTHRAETVVVGLDEQATMEDLWRALETATSAVRRGGKILAISAVRGNPGPAASRLMADDPPGLASLRGAEGETDFAPAVSLTHALGWADIYLLSLMEPETVEALGMIPLSKPAEAQRLASQANEIVILNHPQWTRIVVAEDES